MTELRDIIAKNICDLRTGAGMTQLSLAEVLNYSDKDITPVLDIKESWSIKEIIYGSIDKIPHCDGVIMRIERN